MYYPKLNNIKSAYKVIKHIMSPTPLEYNFELTKKYNNNIYLKREDLTPVRSYKIRGAYNNMVNLNNKYEIVTCSAGNHAQGVAFSCHKLKIYGNIFMPLTTTKQKIDKVKKFGGEYIKINLIGNNFDESYSLSKQFCDNNKFKFIHPFNDEKVIEGQATVGLEILNQISNKQIDYLLFPIGGGGLAAGITSYFKYKSPKTKLIGVEPSGAASMLKSIENNYVTTLDKIDNFVDGAAVKTVGNLNFDICKKNIDEIIIIDEGHVCSKIIEMYNNFSLVIEPAGVLSLCALDKIKETNKNIVSIISGGNSDFFRMPEILQRSLLYK